MRLDDVARVVSEEHHALVLGLVARMAALRYDELLCVQQLGDTKGNLARHRQARSARGEVGATGAHPGVRHAPGCAHRHILYVG